MRAIEFAPLTSGNLGRLQAEDEAREQGSPQGSPPHSPVRIARQTLAALDAVRLRTSLCPLPSIPAVASGLHSCVDTRRATELVYSCDPDNVPQPFYAERVYMRMQAGAAVSSQVHLSEEMERALQQQDALFSGLDRAKQSTSADGGPELTALHASMHSAFR